MNAARRGGSRLAGEVRGLPRAWLGALVLVAAVLVLAPTTITLLRQARFHAFRIVYPVATPPLPAPHGLAYFTRLLRDPSIDIGLTRAGYGSNPRAGRGVELERGARGFRLLATGSTPKDVAAYLDSLGLLLANATAAQGTGVAVRRAEFLELDASVEHRPGRRRALLRSARRYQRLADSQAFRVVVSPPQGDVRPRRWADRLVDRLPGAFPKRPSPLLVALAGLVLSAAVWLAALAVLRRRAAAR